MARLRGLGWPNPIFLAYRRISSGLRICGPWDVGLWHKADMLNALTNVRFWGKADSDQPLFHHLVNFGTQTYCNLPGQKRKSLLIMMMGIERKRYPQPASRLGGSGVCAVASLAQPDGKPG